MNFEEALQIAARHQEVSRPGRSLGVKGPTTSLPGNADAQNNQIRFQQLTQAAGARNAQEEQQAAHMAQQQQQAMEHQNQGKIREINANINAIKENTSLTEKEKNELIHNEEVKKMGLAPEIPPGMPPWPRWQDPGMKWTEDTNEVKPDGTPWKIVYHRANRGDVAVLYNEKEEFEKRENEKRKLDIEEQKIQVEKMKAEAQRSANEGKVAAESEKWSREREKRDADQGAADNDQVVASAERRAAKIASQRVNEERGQWQKSQKGKEKPDPQPNWSQVFEQYKAEELQNEMEALESPGPTDQLATDAQGTGVIDPATGTEIPFNNELGAYEVPI